MKINAYVVNLLTQDGPVVLELPMDNSHSEGVIRNFIHLGFQVTVQERLVEVPKGYEDDILEKSIANKERDDFYHSIHERVYGDSGDIPKRKIRNHRETDSPSSAEYQG